MYPPVSAIYSHPRCTAIGERPKTACPFYASQNAGSTFAKSNLARNKHHPSHSSALLVRRAAATLAHVQAAVDVEHLAGDVAGFVAGKENDRGGDVAVTAEATERDHGLHLVFQFC